MYQLLLKVILQIKIHLFLDSIIWNFKYFDFVADSTDYTSSDFAIQWFTQYSR